MASTALFHWLSERGLPGDMAAVRHHAHIDADDVFATGKRQRHSGRRLATGSKISGQGCGRGLNIDTWAQQRHATIAVYIPTPPALSTVRSFRCSVSKDAPPIIIKRFMIGLLHIARSVFISNLASCPPPKDRPLREAFFPSSLAVLPTRSNQCTLVYTKELGYYNSARPLDHA